MKYSIAALFDEESYQTIAPVQKNISKKYRANRNSSAPYIPIAIIDNPDLEKISEMLDKILCEYKSFRINATDEIFLCDAIKSVNLDIENTGYIKGLSRIINDTLELYGMSFTPFYENFISIASIGYFPKESKKSEGKIFYPNIYDKNKFLKLRIASVEVWKLPFSKKNNCVYSYTLKKF